MKASLGAVSLVLALSVVIGVASAQDHRGHSHHDHGRSDVVAVPCPPNGARLLLSATGEVSLNGQTVAASELSQALAKLEPRPVEICYAREKPGQEPRDSRLHVTKALMGTGVPLVFYTDATFSHRVKGK